VRKGAQKQSKNTMEFSKERHTKHELIVLRKESIANLDPLFSGKWMAIGVEAVLNHGPLEVAVVLTATEGEVADERKNGDLVGILDQVQRTTADEGNDGDKFLWREDFAEWFGPKGRVVLSNFQHA